MIRALLDRMPRKTHFIKGKEHEELRLQLNKLHFPECEDVLIGDVLYYPITFTNIASSPLKPLRILRQKLAVLKKILTSGYVYHTGKKHSALFLFSSAFAHRNDHKIAFLKLRNLFPTHSSAIYDKTNVHLTFKKLRYLVLVISWNKLLKSVINDSLLRASLLTSLCTAFCDYKDIENHLNHFEDIDTLITWCDYHLIGSFFTQKFNSMGKNTITLMHGFITDADFNPWSVKGSKSKHLLADSQFTKDVLEKNNFKGKVWICGYAYSINDYKKPIYIGVLLSGEESGKDNQHNNNIKLCTEIAQLKEQTQLYKFDCKLHPSSRKEKYPHECWEPFSHVYDYSAKMSSFEFLSRLDIAVLCPSTVVYEALYHKIPFLVHADAEHVYKIFGMPEDIVVHDFEDLQYKLKKALAGEYSEVYKKLADYYTVQGDIGKNYIKTLQSLGVGGGVLLS